MTWGFAKQGCLKHEALQRRINLKAEVEDQFQLKLHLNVYWMEVWKQARSQLEPSDRNERIPPV